MSQTQTNDSVTWDKLLKLALHGNTLDVLAATADGAAEEKPAARQITPATPEQITDMKDQGEKAILLQQEIEDLLRPIAGSLAAKQKALKAEKDALLDKMLDHGLKSLKVEGLGTIEIETKKDKKKTLEELKRILTPAEGLKVWKQLTVEEKNYIRLPEVTAPDA